MSRLDEDLAPLLVGRTGERELLSAFPEYLSDGPAALLLVGETGIGKTSLWLDGIRSAARRSTVLVARPSELNRQVAFSGLGELLEVLDDQIDELPDPARRALDRALGRGTQRVSVEAVDVAQAVAVLLLGLARSGPVVVAVDDLPSLDRSSARVVGHVLRRLATSPVGLLACQRGDAAAGLITEALPPDRIRQITVAGLDVPEVEELIRRRLRADFTRPMLARVHAVSGGNPFYALELARAVLRMPGRTAATGPLPVTESLADLIGRRVAALPAATRDALLVVAVAEPASLDVIERVTGAHARSAVQRGLDAGVVAVDAGRIRFTHPLLADTVYAGADPARRRHVHLALAEATHDLEARARHLAAGVALPDPVVATALEAAGEAAYARGAPDSAAELLTSAADLTPVDDIATRHRRTLAAAQQLARIGHSAEAGADFRRLADELPPGAARAKVLQQIGMLERGVGSWPAALDILRQASTEAEQDRALRAEIEQQLALVTMQAGAMPDAVAHLDVARSLATDASIDVLADIEVAELAHHVTAGRRTEPGIAERLVTLARAAIDSSRSDENSTMRVVVAASTLKWLDEFDASRDLLDRLRAVLWEHQQDGLLVPVLFQLCELECWAGLTDRAEELANLADQTRRRAALPGMRGMSSYCGALVAARTGRLVAAREAAARCLEGATMSGDIRNQIRALSLQGFIELSDWRPREGVGPLGRAWKLERRFGYDNPAVIRGAADHIEALLAADRREDARDRLRLLTHQAARTGNPWTISAARRSRGLVAASAGDLGSALSDLESASGAAGVANPLEHGRTLLALAVVRRRCGRRAAAREAAARALAAFSSARAQAWKWQAHDELRRLGATVEVGRELTAAENEIATLTASGLSNKEIAATTHVSVKTVEAHLTHIYRKLGVHTRAQLTAHVNGSHQDDARSEVPEGGGRADDAEATGQPLERRPRIVAQRRP